MRREGINDAIDSLRGVGRVQPERVGMGDLVEPLRVARAGVDQRGQAEGRDQRELQLEQTLEKKLEDRHEARLKEISQQIEQLQRNKAERPGHGNASAGKP